MSPNLFESVLLALIVSTIVGISPAIATNVEAIECNNKGVTFLHENKFEDAVRSFKKALDLDSSYDLARANLSIAYNNLGLEKIKEKSHEDALLLFEQALFIHPSDTTVRANVNGTLKILGHNPSVAADRAALGDMFFRRGASASALMEYEAALALGHQESLLVKERNAREALSAVEPGLLQIHLKQISAMKLGGTSHSTVNMAALTLGSRSGSSVFDIASNHASSGTSAAIDPRSVTQATSAAGSSAASAVAPSLASTSTTPTSTVSPTTSEAKPASAVSPTTSSESKPASTVSQTTSSAVASGTTVASASLPGGSSTVSAPVTKDPQKSNAVNEIDDSSASEFVVLLNNRSYEKVIDKATKALSSHPTSAKLYFYRGRAHYHMKNLPKAVQDARQAVANDSGYIDAYATIGDAEILLGHNKEAIEAYGKAIALTPSKATFYYCRAKAKEADGLKQQSEDDNAKAKSLGESYHKVAGEPTNIDFGPYMAATQKKIKASWHPPKCDTSYKVKTRFRIHYDGRTSDIHVVGAGGEANKDNVALRAVQEARLPELPAGSPPDVDMEFTFEYNVNQEKP